VAALLDVVRVPWLVVRLDVSADERIRSVVWAVATGAAVEVHGEAAGVLVLERVSPDEVLARVGARSVPRARMALDCPPAVVSRETLERASAAAEVGDHAAACDILRPVTGPATAGPLAAVLAARCIGYTVSTYYRREPGQLDGGMTSWLDAADAGLWRVAEPEEDGPLTFQPTSADELATLLAASLPT